MRKLILLLVIMFLCNGCFYTQAHIQLIRETEYKRGYFIGALEISAIADKIFDKKSNDTK